MIAKKKMKAEAYDLRLLHGITTVCVCVSMITIKSVEKKKLAVLTLGAKSN